MIKGRIGKGRRSVAVIAKNRTTLHDPDLARSILSDLPANNERATVTTRTSAAGTSAVLQSRTDFSGKPDG
jgi:hypothetical protein